MSETLPLTIPYADFWKANDCSHEVMAAALARTRKQSQRRRVQKEVLHTLIRKFVVMYITEAKPTDPGITKPERKALLRDLKEKCAVQRAVDQFGRDERTIREARRPSKRSRRRAK
jgi:hypothetical protein